MACFRYRRGDDMRLERPVWATDSAQRLTRSQDTVEQFIIKWEGVPHWDCALAHIWLTSKVHRPWQCIVLWQRWRQVLFLHYDNAVAPLKRTSGIRVFHYRDNFTIDGCTERGDTQLSDNNGNCHSGNYSAGQMRHCAHCSHCCCMCSGCCIDWKEKSENMDK